MESPGTRGPERALVAAAVILLAGGCVVRGDGRFRAQHRAPPPEASVTLHGGIAGGEATGAGASATTAAGDQAYAAVDIPEDQAVALADEAVPGLLTPFVARQRLTSAA